MSRTIFGYKALKNRWSVFCVLNESILKNREHKYKSTCLLSQKFKMAGQRKTYVAVDVATNLDIDTRFTCICNKYASRSNNLFDTELGWTWITQIASTSTIETLKKGAENVIDIVLVILLLISFSSISIVDFEQVNVSWAVRNTLILLKN